MIGTAPAIVLDSLPWWIAMPLLQLALLVTGMVLDETYVNRTTVLGGALALYVHSLVTGGLWLPVGIYLDVGLIVGAYGLYAYVVDGYVGTWFRVLAYFVYSPLSVFLIILFPDYIFFIGLVLAGYANLQLIAYFHPVDPYYFGPEDEAVVDDIAQETGSPEPITNDEEAEPSIPGSGVGRAVGASVESASGTTGTGTQASPGPGSEPTAAAGEPSERGILPEFMRRL